MPWVRDSLSATTRAAPPDNPVRAPAPNAIGPRCAECTSRPRSLSRRPSIHIGREAGMLRQGDKPDPRTRSQPEERPSSTENARSGSGEAVDVSLTEWRSPHFVSRNAPLQAPRGAYGTPTTIARIQDSREIIGYTVFVRRHHPLRVCMRIRMSHATMLIPCAGSQVRSSMGGHADAPCDPVRPVRHMTLWRRPLTLAE